MMSYLPGQQQPDPMSAIMSNPALSEEDKLWLYKAMENMEPSMQQVYLAKIAGMAPDEMKAAIAGISRPYEDERSSLRDELTQNYDMLNAESPQGQMAGNNPFSVYVGANPLEHLASGVNKYMGGKGVREGRAETRALNKAQGEATGEMQLALAEELRKKSKVPMQSKIPGKKSWEEDEWWKQ